MIPPPPTEAEKRRWLREAKKRRKIGPYVEWDKKRVAAVLLSDFDARKCSAGCGRATARRDVMCYDCADESRKVASRKRSKNRYDKRKEAA